ncbi:DUF6415 family natural product biosynthesis protein [Streptomyces sp. NPDC093982]|jgi:hypothetical protein|uniref:DUF6415 family natural product biosynthesis protein n=1 Tax=Streptomyces sp. NPDC093982 TaxID=3155077 RepID=UPI00343196E0
MTIRVYRMDRYGTVTEDRGTVSVLPGDEPPPVTSALPPCACRRCGGQRTGPDGGTQADEEAPALGPVSMRAAATWLLDRPTLLGCETLKLFDQDFRLFLSLVIPHIERMTEGRPEGDPAANVALADVGEARRRLIETESTGLTAEFERVGRMARSVVALCDHFDALSGITTCLACVRRIGHRAAARSCAADHGRLP